MDRLSWLARKIALTATAMKKPAAAAHAATHVKQKPAAARRNRSGKSNWAKWKTLRKQEKEKEKEKEKLRETVSETEKQQEKTFRDIGVQTVAAVNPEPPPARQAPAPQPPRPQSLFPAPQTPRHRIRRSSSPFSEASRRAAVC